MKLKSILLGMFVLAMPVLLCACTVEEAVNTGLGTKVDKQRQTQIFTSVIKTFYIVNMITRKL